MLLMRALTDKCVLLDLKPSSCSHKLKLFYGNLWLLHWWLIGIYPGSMRLPSVVMPILCLGFLIPVSWLVNMFVSCCNPIMDLCTEIFQLSFHGMFLFFLKQCHDGQQLYHSRWYQYSTNLHSDLFNSPFSLKALCGDAWCSFSVWSIPSVSSSFSCPEAHQLVDQIAGASRDHVHAQIMVST